jgi:UDP-2,3-diacylglucosamine pyrophosphatase LpxH
VPEEDKFMGIIAVSDVHLGYLKEDDSKQSLSNKSGFCDLLRDIEARDDINQLVICGDMLDMWRRDMVGVTIENLDVLNMLRSLSKNINVHYLAGNHDYHIRHLNRYSYPFGFRECKDPKEGITLKDGDKSYVFKHGYDLEPGMAQSEAIFDLMCSTSDEVGEFKSHVYSSIGEFWKQGKEAWESIGGGTMKFFTGLEKAWKPDERNKGKFLEGNKISKPLHERLQKKEDFDFNALKEQLSNDATLVFGHTHKPFHHQNIINLGSWITEYPVNSIYLEIKDGHERLLKYPSGEVIPKQENLPSELDDIRYLLPF